MHAKPILLFLALFFLLIPPISVRAYSYTLTFSNDAGEILLSGTLHEKQCFIISYIHSVARTPVEDWFCAEKGSLYLEKTVYQDFGAGLPYRPESGESMRVEKGKIIIEGIHRKLTEFAVRIGRIAQHTILLPKEDGVRTIPMNSLDQEGRALTIRLSTNAATSGKMRP